MPAPSSLPSKRHQAQEQSDSIAWDQPGPNVLRHRFAQTESDEQLASHFPQLESTRPVAGVHAIAGDQEREPGEVKKEEGHSDDEGKAKVHGASGADLLPPFVEEVKGMGNQQEKGKVVSVQSGSEG